MFLHPSGTSQTPTAVDVSWLTSEFLVAHTGFVPWYRDNVIDRSSNIEEPTAAEAGVTAGDGASAGLVQKAEPTQLCFPCLVISGYNHVS